jgi:hypothetical protein
MSKKQTPAPKSKKGGNGKQKKNNSNKPKSKKQKIVTKIIVSDCVKDYLEALTNPWSGVLACVPSEVINSNLIVCNYVRGSFQCGPSVGFICIDPTHMCFNDVPCVISSKSSYAGTAMALNDTANINLDLSNAPYLETDIGQSGNNLSYRIVACGLRVRYTGTELDRGGTIHALVDPTHDPMLNRTIANFGAEKQTRRLPVNRSWSSIIYRPAHQDELLMLEAAPAANTKSPAITVTSGSFSWYMGMLIAPANATSLPSFEYEAAVICEYQGRNVRGQKMTHADPVGLSAAIQAVANVVPTQQPADAIHVSALRSLGQVLRFGMSHMDMAPSFADTHKTDNIIYDHAYADPRRQLG